MSNAKCIRCNVYLRKVPGYKKTISTNEEAERMSKIIGVNVKVNDKLCRKCRSFASVYLSLKNKAQHSSCSKVEINSELTRKLSISPNISEIQPSTSSECDTLPESSTMPSQLSDIVQPTSSNAQNADELEMPSQLISQLSSSLSLTTTTSSLSSTNDPTYEVIEKSENEIQYVDMMFPRVINTHKYCCVCGSKNEMMVIPFEARIQVFVKRKIFIPRYNRCCKHHLIKKRFYEEDIFSLRIYSNTSTFEVSDLENLMKQLSVSSDSVLLDKIGDYSFPEERLKVLTGLTWENLTKLRTMMTSMRNSETRDVIQAIVVFLFKLRTGNSNAVISSVLGLQREQLVSDYVQSVMKSFEQDVLPKYFGINASSRQNILNHSSEIATKLFELNDQLMIICDGTYIRHQKSTNNEYQRKSYSGQKKVPLFKPFTVCTTNGYVIDMLGPFTANKNDAEILKSILEDPNGLIKLLEKGDIFVLDRGFRDVVTHLENLGFKVLMPALKGKRNQLTTSESNDSRFVTKIRWVVESVHGVIKQKFTLLDHKVDNKLLPKAQLFCQIACFLNNEFGKRFNSDKEIADQVLSVMNLKKNQDNTLANDVEREHWARRKIPFETIKSDDLHDFPEMTEKDLHILFTGSYQLSQAVSYLAEIMDKDNNLSLQYVKTAENILKFQVKSRHINAKVYRCFIEYHPNKNGINGISRYCCDCANGRRTVGCCSHVAAIIYYLSHARYLSKIVKPAEILSRIFNNTGHYVVINEDSDED